MPFHHPSHYDFSTIIKETCSSLIPDLNGTKWKTWLIEDNCHSIPILDTLAYGNNVLVNSFSLRILISLSARYNNCRKIWLHCLRPNSTVMMFTYHNKQMCCIKRINMDTIIPFRHLWRRYIIVTRPHMQILDPCRLLMFEICHLCVWGMFYLKMAF